MTDTMGQSAKQLAGVAAQILGWRPAEFWAATPADFRLALGAGDAAAAGMTRAEIEQLMKRDSQ